MNLSENPIYKADINYLAELDLPWDNLKEKTILLSGSTGQMGLCLIDTILLSNNKYHLNCNIVALGRNKEKAVSRFGCRLNSDFLNFVECDLNHLSINSFPKVDYIIHLASSTHPIAYATEPVDTILSNVVGTRNLLELMRLNKEGRFIFASSNEIYGENRGDVELFNEDYCGYINCNTLRAGYPESKRCGEALCQAYLKQYGVDAVIARFTRTYGPTILQSDTKAISQFLQNGLAGEDIILKSSGNQFYSFCHITDAISGLLHVMLKGMTGEAYNIADIDSDVTLYELAKMIADYFRKEVVYDLPSSEEATGFSKATKARLDGSKIKALGWKMKYGIAEGVKATLDVLK